MRLFIFSLIVLPMLCSAAQSGTGDGEGCRKFEEGLYLRTALKDKDGLTSYLDSLRNCGNESPEVLLAVGRYLYNQGDYSGAEQTLVRLTSDATATSAQLGEAYYYLGMAAYNRLYYMRSISLYQMAIEAGYMPHWCHNNIGLALEKSGLFEEAIEQYRKALEYHPEYAVANNNIGVIYDRMGNDAMAVRYFRLADSQVGGKDPLYRSNLTRAYRDIPDLEAQLASAATGYAKFPNDKRNLKDYALAISAVGRFDEARTIGRKLLSMGPSTIDDWFDLGYIYSEVGLADSSAAFYHIVLKKNPSHIDANLNIAIYYRRFGQFDKAHHHLDKALAGNPNYEFAILSKRQAYLWQMDFENYYRWAQLFNEKFPESKYNHLGMGYALMHLGRYNEAIPWLEEKLKRMPNDDRALNNLGQCYGKLGDTPRAFEYFRQALAINPDNSFVYHNRASVYCDLESFDLACADLQTAINKEYNWIIDSTLLIMRNKHCPHIVTDRKVLIHEYSGNATELKGMNFIELMDAMIDNIEINAALDEEELMSMPTEMINTSTFQSAFQVYPNPSTGLFTVEGTLPDQADRWVKVFDIQGRTIVHMPMNNDRAQLDISSSGPGTYVVMVMDAGAVLSTRKVVVQK